MSMPGQATFGIERDEDGYLALSSEFDIASQGHTIDEARFNLAEALSLFFETADASEISRRSGQARPCDSTTG
jgi:predicted RNase H-like HicB family nuclease